MSETVIKVENLSKQYRLGKIGTGTLSHDLNRWWYKVRGKEDPYLKISEENKREHRGNSEYVWALRDIDFEVKRGEALGIIGKNGAGKSTILKILSRVANPTVGEVKIKGRVASLLEVGTGFNQELTGRENIFLNGTILGMTKAEIKSKLDEIVAFSGVERYIDTPVKRYSSGMKVRLGFAVAAHLEPEIMIIDEVLAVGDAEFQKKCLGKMQDVAQGGRTVLFVSHNMNAVNRLCSRGMLLSNGKVAFVGGVKETVDLYLKENVDTSKLITLFEPPLQENKEIELIKAEIIKVNGEPVNENINVYESFIIKLKYNFNTDVSSPKLTFHIKNIKDEIVLFSDILDNEKTIFPTKKGIYNYSIHIEQPLLKPGIYNISLGITIRNELNTNHFPTVLTFQIVDFDNQRRARKGYIFKNLEWKLNSEN